MSTIVCNNMYQPDMMEYVGDSYDAIIRNFACLDTRACNLIAKGEGYVTMGKLATSYNDYWSSPAAVVKANGDSWNDFANTVFWTSAFWLGPITVMYQTGLPPGLVTPATVLAWLTTTFVPSAYPNDQEIIVQTAVLNQDPAIHNTTYEWSIGLSLSPTYVDRFACFRFVLTQDTGTKMWTQVDRCNSQGRPFPPQTCSGIYGQFRGWISCNVPNPSAANAIQPYYMLTDCAKVLSPCYFPAGGGQYDSYVGKIVHMEGSNTDYVLSRVYPATVPSSMCTGSLTIREVCEATSCPDTCYSLTPATSAGLVACGSLTTYRDLSDYVGKYVRLLNSNLCWFVQKAPYCGCAVDVILHDDYCFELQDCKGCADSVWTNTDLHKYENQVVMIDGYPQRWSVVGHNCPNLAGSCAGTNDKRIAVNVTQTFATCEEPCPCPTVSVIGGDTLTDPFTEQTGDKTIVIDESIYDPPIVVDEPWLPDATTWPPTTSSTTSTTTSSTTSTTTSTTTSSTTSTTTSTTSTTTSTTSTTTSTTWPPTTSTTSTTTSTTWPPTTSTTWPPTTSSTTAAPPTWPPTTSTTTSTTPAP